MQIKFGIETRSRNIKVKKEDCGCIGSSQVGVRANYMNVKSDGDDKEHAIQALTSLKSNLISESCPFFREAGCRSKQ